MKKSAMIAAGVAGSLFAAYVLINKETRKKAEKLMNSRMDEADSMIKNGEN